MRPGQNKRMRGRNNNNNNNRKGPNPLTRSYESNGPDVKIRGTAHHIGEKYLQLARDAQSSGDPVMAESYLQHAEHYFRLIAAAQQAQQQAAYGYQRPAGEPEQDEDNDDDFESLPDRFASPSERAPQPSHQNQPYGDRPPAHVNGGQPYEPRPPVDRQPQPQYQPQQDRHHQPQQDRQPGFNQERSPQDRTYDNRGGRNDRGDRGGYQGNGHQANGQHQGERQPRDYDNRNFRGNRPPRDFRDAPQPREQRQPQSDEPAAVAGGLPAFITGPTRSAPDAPIEQPDVDALPREAADGPSEDGSLHMRPRRRRRPKGDLTGATGNGDAGQEAGEGGDGARSSSSE